MTRLLLLLAASLCYLSAGDLLTSYRAARDAAPDPSRVVTCENIELQRPSARFVLTSGTIAFLPPLAGRTYAAVFSGSGVFRFTPPDAIERGQIRRFVKKADELEERFSSLVLFFSDTTEADLLRQGKAAPGAVSAHESVLKDARSRLRQRNRDNTEALVLHYLTGSGGSFRAFINGRDHGELLYDVSPEDGEEVSLARLKHEDLEIWSSYSLPAGASKQLASTRRITVDSRIEPNTDIAATAEVEFSTLTSSGRLLRFGLDGALRVTEVRDASGAALDFIQEDKRHDSVLWVVTPAPAAAGQEHRWKFTYAGVDLIQRAGDGNFFVTSRSNWFPRLASPWTEFSDRTHFRLTFRVPKNLHLVATGKELGRRVDGKWAVTEWETERPDTVAGFNYGVYKRKDMEANGFKVSVLANSGLSADMQQLQYILSQNRGLATAAGITEGAFSTTGMTDNIAAETLNCLTLYTRLFGEIPQKSLYVTQQPAGFFGQSWPGLLFMPYTSFLDSTGRHQLGLDRRGIRAFLEDVGPHEIAHQWWGHAVVWRGYRDQWLSEGFATYSAALQIEATKGLKPFLANLKETREQIFLGYGSTVPPNDLGPISLGVRLAADDAPSGYQLVYAKGAWVLHMLRMLAHDYNTHSDAMFLNMMRDFVRSHAAQPATNDSFQSIVSKHYQRDMKYFFDQWVHGTGVPKIQVEYALKPVGERSRLEATFRVTGVPDGFRVDLPVELRFKNGQVRTGRLRFAAPNAQTAADLPAVAESAEFNPRLDVLCDLDVRKK